MSPLLVLLVSAMGAAPLLAQARGTVTGRVVHAQTLEPIASVQVSVVGTTLGGLTGPNGRYVILNVPAGPQEVRAERIGFSPVTQSVDVTQGGTTESNFALGEVALGLDEIVVTGAAGAARRREVGNSIGQITASEVAEPVTNVDAMLQGRVPGLTLQETGGAVGSGGRIRLRGNVSATLSNFPLVYIDGVRVRAEGYPKNVPPTGYAGRSTNTTASPLSDLNPADIERVEVIKGPAATTLYGTEAAAGVIQIFTKTGSRGAAQWTAQIDQSALHLQEFGPVVGLRGEPLVVPESERDYFATYFDADDTPHSTRMFMDPFTRTGHRQNYALSVRGGLEDLNYYVSGQFEDVTGVHLSEGSEKYAVRGNLSFKPASSLDMRWNSAYTRTHFDQVPNGGNAQGIHLNAQRRSQNYFNDEDPEVIKEILRFQMDQYIDRFTTGFSTTYAPTSDFSNRLTLGYDLAQVESRQIRPFGFFFAPEGILSNERWSETNLTVDYVGSYAFGLAEALRSTFSWGGQSITRDERAVHGQANEFPGPGDPTLSSGAVKLVFENRIRVINAGFFFQNMFDLDNRYFLTLGVRVDGNSAFGEDLGLQAFPKVSASWVVSDESFWSDSWGALKLRGAWGQSGRAPGAFDAVRTWDPLGFGGQPAFLPLNVGNPDLGPERTTELELGFDASLLSNRLDVDFTWYRQKTTDALFQVTQIPSSGFVGSQLENRGEIENWGIEAAVDVAVFATEDWGLDLGASIYTNENEVLDLGGTPEFTTGVRGWVMEGQPAPVMRGNCITNPNEVAEPIIEADCIYGPNQPTHGWTASTTLRMPGGLSLYSRGEFQGGHWMYSNFEGEAYARGIRWPTCFNAYPLIDSGRIDELTARERAICITRNADRDFAIMPADFFKVREVTLAVPIPTSLLPRVASATLTLSGRNIYRWTKDDLFGFTEPEASGDWNRDSVGNVGNVMMLGATPPPATYTASIRVNF